MTRIKYKSNILSINVSPNTMNNFGNFIGFQSFLCFFAALNTESENIVACAQRLFMQVGIKSVTMDDIATELGISKKTIYKYFENKVALVEKVMDTVLAKNEMICHTCTTVGEENAVLKMINLSKSVSLMHRNMNPAVLYDLQKYYKSQWLKLENFRNQFIKSVIVQNLEEGQNTGFFKTNTQPEITAFFYVTLVAGMINQLLTKGNSFDFKTLHYNLVKYHLCSIATEKGRSYINNHIDEILQ